MAVLVQAPAKKPKRRIRKDFETASMGKYHNRFLFDLCGDEIAKCLARLEDQSKIYESRSAASRWKMRTRALFVAAFTLNATAIWTAKLLTKGTFSMVTQFRFFKKRWRLDPVEWGQNAKSCFARALSGHSVGQDAVCVDRHLQRMDLLPKNAAEQWRDWFRIYESLYGPGEAALCIRWHVEVLDWIAMLRGRPSAWK